jgi:UvrD-like helicase C-terminal domain/Nuclease-related domain/AAA domain
MGTGRPRMDASTAPQHMGSVGMVGTRGEWARPEGFANDRERFAFEQFRSQLEPEGWVIAHNLYVSLDVKRGVSARELDLLLLHPRRGIILVEVKGGTVQRFRDGTWHQNGKAMDGPDMQAMSALRRLRNAVDQRPSWSTLNVDPPFGWMLCLTDADALAIARSRAENSTGLAGDQIIDRQALVHEGGILDAVTRFTQRIGDAQGGFDPGFDWTDLALQIISPELGFSTSLVGDLEVDRARLAQDERIHRDWVENLAALPRVHFEGGAGAGKSILARLRGLSLAEKGQRVLLVCSTAGLAKFFQQEVEARSDGRVVANTVHQALLVLARGTGTPEQFGVPAEGPLTIPQLQSLPSQASAIATATTRPFDALVVDEAQDVGANVIRGLCGFLREPAAGSVWTFGDAFQRLYPTSEQIPATEESPALGDAAVVVMRQNHRNPEPVFRLAEGLRSDGLRRTSRKGTISAHRVAYLRYVSSDEQRPVLEQEIDNLMQQRIEPGRVAVVTMGKTDRNPLFLNRRIGAGRFPVELDNPQLDRSGLRIPVPAELLPAPDPRTIYFDSVRRIKGLERGVVILVDVPDPGPVGSIERRLLYIAITRATTYLCVIATADRIAKLESIAAGVQP